MTIAASMAALLLLQDPAPDIRVDVELVRIPCTVTDRKGIPAKDLTAASFTIRDNGRTRPVKYFARDTDIPLTVGLVVDISGSQRKFAAVHRHALAQFFKHILRKGDSVFIASLERDVRLVQDFTDSPQVLDAALERLQPRIGVRMGEPCATKEIYIRGNRSVRVSPCGGSVIWDGVYYAAEKMKKAAGRKAIIVMTDGEDSGSPHSVQQAIAMAQDSETIIYPVKSAGRHRLSAAIRKPLDKLASETGGLVFDGSYAASADSILSKIQAELRTQYVLGFNADGPRDGSFHELKVNASRGLSVRTRSGYWARKE